MATKFFKVARKEQPVKRTLSLLLILCLFCLGFTIFSSLKASNDYPSAYLHKDAIAYFQFNGDPSFQQKRATYELTRNAEHLWEKRDGWAPETLITDLLSSISSTTVNEAWVGDRMAVAFYPDNADGNMAPEIALLIKTSNSKKARKELPVFTRGLEKQDFFGAKLTFRAAIINDTWVGVTTSDPNLIFRSNETLATKTAFQEEFGAWEAQTLSFWIESKGMTTAMNRVGLLRYGLEGHLTGGLTINPNGAEFRVLSTDLTMDGKPAYLQGDAVGLQKLLQEHAYSDPTITLGFVGQAGFLAPYHNSFYKYFDYEMFPNKITLDEPVGITGDTFLASFQDNNGGLTGNIIFRGLDDHRWKTLLTYNPEALNALTKNTSSLLEVEGAHSLTAQQFIMDFDGKPDGLTVNPAPKAYGFVALDDALKVLERLDFNLPEARMGWGTLELLGESTSEVNDFVMTWRLG